MERGRDGVMVERREGWGGGTMNGVMECPSSPGCFFPFLFFLFFDADAEILHDGWMDG